MSQSVPGDMGFAVRAEERRDHLRVLVTGELDLYREAELRNCVDALLVDRPPERLVLDVCGLRFLDSTGLRALLACRDRARSAGVPLTVAVTAGPVTRLLDVAGVRDWFHYE